MLSRFPVRIAVTDHCNLDCFFCSNEGMSIAQKNLEHIDNTRLSHLLDVLNKQGLNHLSITGGDPVVHPEFSELIKKVVSLKIPLVYLHTNGIGLQKDMIREDLHHLTKIAISYHASDFPTWNILTSGSYAQFAKRKENIEMLASEGYGRNVEIKHIPIRGINDSENNIFDTLELCASYGFRFKFLKLEPTKQTQHQMVIGRKDMENILEGIGCKRMDIDLQFRGQKEYVPVSVFNYKNIKGVVAEINCGDKATCEQCYNSNEIFITPDLKLKPCHISEYSIDLKPMIDNDQERDILDSIINTRSFLYSRILERKGGMDDNDEK